MASKCWPCDEQVTCKRCGPPSDSWDKIYHPCDPELDKELRKGWIGILLDSKLDHNLQNEDNILSNT